MNAAAPPGSWGCWVLSAGKGFVVTIATTSDTKLTRNVLLAAVRR